MSPKTLPPVRAGPCIEPARMTEAPGFANRNAVAAEMSDQLPVLGMEAQGYQLPPLGMGAWGYQLPVLGMEAQGSAGGFGAPRCRSSMEIPSGERMKAMLPSRGGRLMVTPPSMSFWQVS